MNQWRIYTEKRRLANNTPNDSIARIARLGFGCRRLTYGSALCEKTNHNKYIHICTDLLPFMLHCSLFTMHHSFSRSFFNLYVQCDFQVFLTTPFYFYEKFLVEFFFPESNGVSLSRIL